MGSRYLQKNKALFFGLLICGQSIYSQDHTKATNNTFISNSQRTHAFFSRSAQEEMPIRTRVVLIALDGVRTEEIFIGSYPYRKKRSYRHSRKFLMPFLWNTLAKNKATLQLGNFYKRQRRKRSYCYIDNPSGRSLPAYANLFSRHKQINVTTNQFKGQLRHVSIIDELRSKQSFHHNHFAIFASWAPIKNILSLNTNKAIFNTGYHRKSPRPPWHHARYDYYTYKATMKFLQKNNNFRFLFVSFNDSDEWGHYGRYSRYLRAIKRQDNYIRGIYRQLTKPQLPLYNTTFIITTDHGRGRGRYWKQHSSRLRGPKRIWAFIHNHSNIIQNTSGQLHRQSQDLKDFCTHTSIAKLIYRILKNP